ncbi:hypothetical protein PABG_12593 [Paracoccidioides brasiliensis Pb03]|nr:hypothetical protein PABG_12593 [Paracoccidioides brasiliensis Pb03]
MVLSVVFLIYTGRRSHQLSKSGGPPPNQSQFSPYRLGFESDDGKLQDCAEIMGNEASKRVCFARAGSRTANTTPTRHSTDDAAGSGGVVDGRLKFMERRMCELSTRL